MRCLAESLADSPDSQFSVLNLSVRQEVVVIFSIFSFVFYLFFEYFHSSHSTKPKWKCWQENVERTTGKNRIDIEIIMCHKPSNESRQHGRLTLFLWDTFSLFFTYTSHCRQDILNRIKFEFERVLQFKKKNLDRCRKKKKIQKCV